MNTPAWSSELAAQGLLDLIEADCARQRSQVLGQAQALANELSAQARSQARELVRRAFAEQRQRHSERLHAAQAQLATQRRLHAQQRTAALLRLARQRLPGVLLALWQQPPARAAWVARTLQAAKARLPQGAWQVVHAADWPEAEALALAAELHASLGAPAQLVPSAGIAAGLKLSIAGNVIDASLDGLLASRSEVEARLARLLESAS